MYCTGLAMDLNQARVVWGEILRSVPRKQLVELTGNRSMQRGTRNLISLSNYCGQMKSIQNTDEMQI